MATVFWLEKPKKVWKKHIEDNMIVTKQEKKRDLMYRFWSWKVDGVCSSFSNKRCLSAWILVSTSAYTRAEEQRLYSSYGNWLYFDWFGFCKTESFTFLKNGNLCITEERFGLLIVIDYHIVITLREKSHLLITCFVFNVAPALHPRDNSQPTFTLYTVWRESHHS